MLSEGINEEPQNPRRFCERMPEELANVILGMVSKEKDDRHLSGIERYSCKELLTDFNALFYLIIHRWQSIPLPFHLEKVNILIYTC